MGGQKEVVALSVVLQENVTAHRVYGYLLMLWAFPSMSRLAYNLADRVEGAKLFSDASPLISVGFALWEKISI